MQKKKIRIACFEWIINLESRAKNYFDCSDWFFANFEQPSAASALYKCDSVISQFYFWNKINVVVFLCSIGERDINQIKQILVSHPLLSVVARKLMFVFESFDSFKINGILIYE